MVIVCRLCGALGDSACSFFLGCDEAVKQSNAFDRNESRPPLLLRISARGILARRRRKVMSAVEPLRSLYRGKLVCAAALANAVPGARLPPWSTALQ